MSPSLRRIDWRTATKATNERLGRITVWAIITLLAANQIIMGSLMPQQAGAATTAAVRSLFGIKTSNAYTIPAPQINPDGKTTSLVEQPTISQVPANPNSGDALADAKVVVLGTGTPDYAPSGASFSDPITAQTTWGTFESLNLTGAALERYNRLSDTLPCSYCCGEPGNVTHNKNCGCAHAKAARGFFRYMIDRYADQYTDQQLLGEAFRWQAIWYPKGAVEDYLLATGKSNVIGHAPHGGAGADGMHGLTTK